MSAHPDLVWLARDARMADQARSDVMAYVNMHDDGKPGDLGWGGRARSWFRTNAGEHGFPTDAYVSLCRAALERARTDLEAQRCAAEDDQ